MREKENNETWLDRKRKRDKWRETEKVRREYERVYV